MKSPSLTIYFEDEQDKSNFLWIMEMAKKSQHTLPPLACGLISMILNRLKLKK